MKLFKGLLLTLSFLLAGAFASVQARATTVSVEHACQTAVHAMTIDQISYQAEAPVLSQSTDSLFDVIAFYNQKKPKTAKPTKPKKSPIQKTSKKLSHAQQSKTSKVKRELKIDAASTVSVSPQAVFPACFNATITSYEFSLLSRDPKLTIEDCFGFTTFTTLAIS